MKATTLVLLLALCAATTRVRGRVILDSVSTPTCPVYALGVSDLDSCMLTEASEGTCNDRTWHVLVPAVSTGIDVVGYPGGLGTWACECDALYSDTSKNLKDIDACIACKVCGVLQTTIFPSGWACDPKKAAVDATYSCAVPFVRPGYYVNCGLAGPYVQVGSVTVPDDVWAAIKDITCPALPTTSVPTTTVPTTTVPATVTVPQTTAATCPVYAPGEYDLDSCMLTEDTEGICNDRTWHILVPAVSAGINVNGYPGGLGTWGCPCDALYSDGILKDEDACIACKVCGVLQTTTYPQSGRVCDPQKAVVDSTYSCTAPFPKSPAGYYVNCGLAGPYVQVGTVTVPDDVWASLKDISC